MRRECAMLATVNLGISFEKKKLFENVSVEFSPGNCYGLIGANGAENQHSLKILAGDLDSSEGHVTKDKKPPSPWQTKPV